MNNSIRWKEISNALGFNPAYPPTTDEMISAIEAMRNLISAESKVAFELECILSEGYSGRWFDSAHEAIEQHRQAINNYAKPLR